MTEFRHKKKAYYMKYKHDGTRGFMLTSDGVLTIPSDSFNKNGYTITKDGYSG